MESAREAAVGMGSGRIGSENRHWPAKEVVIRLPDLKGVSVPSPCFCRGDGRRRILRDVEVAGESSGSTDVYQAGMLQLGTPIQMIM